MSTSRLLIVHPDASIGALMTSMVQTLGRKVEEAPNDRTAVRLMEHAPADLVISGVTANDPDGLELLNYVRRKHPRVPVVVVLSENHADRRREAFQRGAAAVLHYPFTATGLRAAVAQALGLPETPGAMHVARTTVATNGNGASHEGTAVGISATSWKADTAGRRATPTMNGRVRESNCTELSTLVGEDAAFRQVVDLAAVLASSRAPVLIEGEKGTGKSLLGRAMHAAGDRREGPLVEFDSTQLREHVVEAELFGRRGLTPGDDRTGKIARADGGTLLLNEVGGLPRSIQARLLRLLREGVYEPLGADCPVRVDVRLIVTSTEDLAALVEEGAFVPELCYRLSAVRLKLPPLRHRPSDIEPLAEAFRARFAVEYDKPSQGFTTEAFQKLRGHAWAGNVRELEHAVERGVAKCRNGWIEADALELASRDVPLSISSSSRRQAPPGIMPLKEALEAPEKQLILQALEALNWNRQETARVLDINRTTLYKKMKKYGLLFDEPAWAGT